MKKASVFTIKNLFWAILIIIVPLLGACQKDGGIDQEEMIDLKDIPENPAFADLPLIGTKWKLVGFANTKTERIKLADVGLWGEDRLPECAKCFILFLDENNTYEYFSTTNRAIGTYRIENANSRLIFEEGVITMVGERGDGKKYKDAMNKVERFNISSYGLALYYDSPDYLLFQPVME